MRTIFVDPSREQKEQSFFDSFVTLAEDLPSGTWERRESPDYILHSENRRFGLEVTTLVLPTTKGKSSLTAIRRSQEKAFQIAAAMASSRGVPPLEVKAKFTSDHQPLDEQAAAQELFEFVVRTYPAIDDRKTWHFQNQGLRYFNWVSIHLGTAYGRQ